MDFGKTGDELKSIAVDSELRNDMVKTALDEEADHLASNLPQEEAVAEDSGGQVYGQPTLQITSQLPEVVGRQAWHV